LISDNRVLDVVLFLAVLLPSVILHEVSHGWVAERLGDPTARRAGRLTLNPDRACGAGLGRCRSIRATSAARRRGWPEWPWPAPPPTSP
jgi:hypothetical protein